MATVILRMIMDLLVKGARHQSIPAAIRLSTLFLDIGHSLRIYYVCLLQSDLFLKKLYEKLKRGLARTR